jgi:hypothetical protein
MSEIDIWHPDRARLDDEANGDKLRYERRNAPVYEDISFQLWIDEVHLYEKKWAEKYPDRGMPPINSPDWDEYVNGRPLMGFDIGKKITLKAAF